MATPEIENRFEKSCEVPAQPNEHVASEAIADEPRAQAPNTAVLCELEIVENGTAETVMDSATGRPEISGDALKQSAIALYDAMHPGLFGSVDYEKVRNILDSYSADDRKRLEAAYNALKDTDDLRTDLKNRVEPHQFREAEAMLERTGETNLIGAVTVALETALQVDAAKGGEMLIGIVSKLDETELQDLKLNWTARYGAEYGGSYEAAINNSNLSDEDKYLLLGVFAGGQDKRTAAQVKIAADELLRRYEGEWTNDRANEYLDRMQVLLSGRGVGRDARRELRADSDWVARYEEAFNPSAIYFESQVATFNRAKDILAEGGVSPATVVAGDMQNSSESWNAIMDGDWVSQNPEHVEEFLSGLDSRYRTDFTEGRRLSGQDYSQLSADQKEQVDFYKKMDETFRQRGNVTQQIVWADMLANGRKTLVSQIAELNTEDGHTTEALVNAVEKMSAQDWQLIRSASGNPSEYLTQLKATIATFATPAEQTRLFNMLDQRSTQESFEAATSIKRTFAEQMSELEGDEPGTRQAVARVIQGMTDADVQAYLSDPALRASIDRIVFPDMKTFDASENNSSLQDRAALFLAQTLLTQAAADGKAPKVEGNVMAEVAKGIMEGTNQGRTQEEMHVRMQQLFGLMNDPAVLAGLRATDALLNTDRTKISSYDFGRYTMLEKLDPSGEAFKQMLIDGRIDIVTQIQYGGRLDTSSIYSQHLGLSEARRARVESHMSPEQKEILEYVRQQGGRTDLVDEFRSYVIGMRTPAAGDNAPKDYRFFVDKLRNMTVDQRTSFLQDYEKKYHGTGVADFTAAIEKTDTPTGGYEDVVRELLKNNFQSNPMIDARLAVLDGNENLDSLIGSLAKMDSTARRNFIDQYNSTWKSDAHSDLLGLVENNYSQSIKLANLLRAEGSDPFQTYLDRLSRFDTTGMDPDGTKEAVRMALEQNADLIAEYKAKRMELPQELRDEMDRYFEQAVMANRDARQSAADDIRMKFQIAAAVVAVMSIPLHGGAGLAALGGAATISTGSAALQMSALGDGMITDDQTREIMIAAGIDVALTVGPAVVPFTKILNARRAAAIDNAIVPATTEGRVLLQVDNAVGDVAPGIKAQEELDALAAARSGDMPVPANDNTLVAQLESEAAREARIRRQIIREQQLDGESVQALAGKVKDDTVVVEHADDLEAPIVGAKIEEPELPTAAANDNDPLAAARRRDMQDDVEHSRTAITIDETGEAIGAAGPVDNAAEIERLRRLERLQERKFSRAADDAAEEVEDIPASGGRIADDADNTTGAGSGSTDEFAGKLKDDEIEVIDNATGRRMVGQMDRGMPAVVPDEVARAAAADTVIAERAAAMADRLRRGWQNLRERAVPYIDAIENARVVTAPAVALHNAESVAQDLQEQQPEVQPVVEAAPLPSKQLIELATVKRGEGPWQSAERILAASGQKFGVDEVRALTRAIQAVYKAEHGGNGDMSGLKVKYNFITNDNYDDLMAALKSEEVKAILAGMALSPVA